MSQSNNLNELYVKVRKRAKIRNRYNQAPHLTKDTIGKVATSQLDITNESQEVSPFPAGLPAAGKVMLFLFMYNILQSKEECKDQESIQSSTIPDPGHHMRK